MNIVPNIESEIKKNWVLIVLLLFSTGFFFYQHNANLSWDFSVYVSNAKYWAGVGEYFEILRPPLAPLMILILSPFGWFASEYIYILIVSSIFLYSTIKLADCSKVNRELLYFFSLSPYVLFYGFINGTELLSLALLELFLVSLFENKRYSGVLLALASLTRYTLLMFFPLFLLDIDRKKLVFNLLLFVLTLLPWFGYNFYATGDMLTSMANSYALNIKARFYIKEPFTYAHLLQVSLFATPLVLFGVIKSIKSCKSSYSSFWKTPNGKGLSLFDRIFQFIKKERINFTFLLILAISLYQFNSISFKHIQYLFSMVLPVSYFSVIGVAPLKKISKRFLKLTAVLILILNLFYLIVLDATYPYENDAKFNESIKLMQSLGIAECRTLSNGWAILNYLKKNSEPFPREELVQKTVEEGNFILLFYRANEPEYVKNTTFLKTFPVILNTEEFILIGNLTKCNPTRKVDQSYLYLLHEIILDTRGYSINTNPCFIIFDRIPIAEGFCNFVNLRGFKIDKNRLWV